MAQTNKNELDEQVENTCEEVKENGKEKTEKKSCRKDKLNEKELAEKNKKITELEEALKESEDKYLRMLAEYDKKLYCVSHFHLVNSPDAPFVIAVEKYDKE